MTLDWERKAATVKECTVKSRSGTQATQLAPQILFCSHNMDCHTLHVHVLSTQGELRDTQL